MPNPKHDIFVEIVTYEGKRAVRTTIANVRFHLSRGAALAYAEQLARAAQMITSGDSEPDA